MTSYHYVRHRYDLYEFAISQSEEQDHPRVDFVHLYEQGSNQPREVSFDHIPEEVVRELIRKLQ